MIEQEKYVLFSLLKRKNATAELFQQQLNKILHNKEDITQIECRGKNLLYYCALYENEFIFEYLTTHYSQEFKPYFKECLSLVYTNKSPHILSLCLKHIPTDTNTQEWLQELSSSNCFRHENISLVSNWIKEHCENPDLLIFNLSKFNNVSFLNQISKDSFWKEKLTKNFSSIMENVKKFKQEIYYERLLANESSLVKVIELSPLISPTLALDIPFSIEPAKKQIIKETVSAGPQITVIKKRRKAVIS